MTTPLPIPPESPWKRFQRELEEALELSLKQPPEKPLGQTNPGTTTPPDPPKRPPLSGGAEIQLEVDRPARPLADCIQVKG
jgi:hypothetical protein